MGLRKVTGSEERLHPVAFYSVRRWVGNRKTSGLACLTVLEYAELSGAKSECCRHFRTKLVQFKIPYSSTAPRFIVAIIVGNHGRTGWFNWRTNKQSQIGCQRTARRTFASLTSPRLKHTMKSPLLPARLKDPQTVAEMTSDAVVLGFHGNLPSDLTYRIPILPKRIDALMSYNYPSITSLSSL